MRHVTAFLVLLVAVRTAGAADVDPLGDQQIIERAGQIIGQMMKRPEAVGLSVAVARGDKLLLEQGLGIADLEFDAPADAQTMFRIGSVTKQFTAAAIMKLVERGRLALDDDLRKHLPSFDTGGRLVTIRQLLNHTSGVPSYTSRPKFMAEIAPLELTHEQLLATVQGVAFDFEPGKGWNYSNTGYYLLGMVIEAVDGRPYGQFLQEEFFTPLGLARTRYASERDIIRNRAQGYGLDAQGVRVNDAPISMAVPGAAGAISSTAGDLLRWQMALAGGRAVSAASYRQMTESSVPTTQGAVRYGFGLNISESGGRKTVSHAGGINGFNSVLTYLPGSALHVAVISNSETLPSAAVSNAIIAAITSSAPLAPPRTEAKGGSEAALRRLLAELARGEPDYSQMGEQLAAATRAQLPQMQPMLQSLGAIDTVTFAGVGLQGGDQYEVKFANGSRFIFAIGLDDAGKVVGAAMRPAPAN